MFGLFSASGHQKLLQIAKRPSFSASFYKNALVKTVQNQHEHKIGRIITIVGICCFLDPEHFGPLHLPPHVIHTILRFFPQPDSLHNQILRKAGQKKAEPNRPMPATEKVISPKQLEIGLMISKREIRSFSHFLQQKNTNSSSKIRV